MQYNPITQEKADEIFEKLKQRYQEKVKRGVDMHAPIRIEGKAAMTLYAELKAHDRFRANSMTRSGGKVIR